jgi:DNA-binding transcriptional regulator YiaG
MTDEHTAYEELAGDRRRSEQYRQGYAEARRAFLIGQAVRERRLALGLSQVELAARAGMTQPALSRLEAGAHHPTARTDQHGPQCRPHRRDSPPRRLKLQPGSGPSAPHSILPM